MDIVDRQTSEPGQPAADCAAGEARRVQVAAVAAQQIALDEAEARLRETRAALAREQQRLDDKERELNQREAALRHEQLHFESESALAKVRVGETLERMNDQASRWRQRRHLERAALRVRHHELADAARHVAAACQELADDQRAWRQQRQTLLVELEGLDARIVNQRRVLAEQEARLRSINEEIQQKRENTPTPESGAIIAASGDGAASQGAVAELAPAAAPLSLQRIADLDRLADDLAEQRLLVVEAWERLARIHEAWHAERSAAARELEALSHQLLERDLGAQAREQIARQGEEVAERQRRDAARAQHELIAGQARLQAQASTWAAEQAQALAALRGKEALATRHVALLAELRDRWIERRRHEVELLQADRADLKSLREETIKLREELLDRGARLDDEERKLTERHIALEQYRQATLAEVGDDPQAAARLDGLRRRWVLQNAQALRRVRQARAALRAELAVLAQRDAAWLRRATAVATAEADLTDLQSADDQRRVDAEMERAQWDHDLRQANAQREAALGQLAALRQEIERMAGAILAEPESTPLSLDRAA